MRVSYGYFCDLCGKSIAESCRVQVRLRFMRQGRYEGRRWLDYHHHCWERMNRHGAKESGDEAEAVKIERARSEPAPAEQPADERWTLGMSHLGGHEGQWCVTRGRWPNVEFLVEWKKDLNEVVEALLIIIQSKHPALSPR